MVCWGHFSAALTRVSGLALSAQPLTANRYNLLWVGLSALAQPRLTKGGQPYQKKQGQRMGLSLSIEKLALSASESPSHEQARLGTAGVAEITVALRRG